MKRFAVKKPNIKEKRQLEDRINYPVFCFRYLHKNYHIDKCDANEKLCFLEKIVSLSSRTWHEIEFTGRHASVSEKISRDAIKLELPEEISEEVTFFLALRFCGKKLFVGFRNKFIFHILYIDRDFTLYKH